MGTIHRGQHTSIGKRTCSIRRLHEHGGQCAQGDGPRHVESIQYGEWGIRAENTRDERSSSQDPDSSQCRKNILYFFLKPIIQSFSFNFISIIQKGFARDFRSWKEHWIHQEEHIGQRGLFETRSDKTRDAYETSGNWAYTRSSHA